MRVAVIGAGITGLTAAFRLRERGFAVQVFEQAAYPGGSIRTIREAGYLIEGGPNTLMLGSTEAKQLIRDVGLEPSLQVANTAAKKRPGSARAIVLTSILSKKWGMSARPLTTLLSRSFRVRTRSGMSVTRPPVPRRSSTPNLTRWIIPAGRSRSLITGIW